MDESREPSQRRRHPCYRFADCPAKWHKELRGVRPCCCPDLPSIARIQTSVSIGFSRTKWRQGSTPFALYPAWVLGLNDRIRSLEKGRHAALITNDGDPLDVRTQVSAPMLKDAKSTLPAGTCSYTKSIRRSTNSIARLFTRLIVFIDLILSYCC